MKDYNFKNDLSNILYILTIAFTLSLLFVLFSALFIYPIYLLSVKYTKVYSLVIVYLLLLSLIILQVLIIRKKSVLYRSVFYGILHYCVYYIAPVFFTAIIIFVDAVIFRVIFSLVHPVLGVFIFLLINVVIFGVIILYRKSIHRIKQRLSTLNYSK